MADIPMADTNEGPGAAAAALIPRFRALDPESDEKVRLVAALEGAVDHPDVLPFLASVVADPGEYEPARVEAATVLRLNPPADPERRLEAGTALVAALVDPDEDVVRQYAAAALGPYAADPAVRRALDTAVRSDDDPLVRDNAFAACREAGPSDAGVALLRELVHDPVLGTAASRVLGEWYVPVCG